MAETKRVGSQAKGLGYVIYAICDPTTPDERWPDLRGTPIYVGQSKQLQLRANAHMRDGGGGTQDRGRKTDRLKQIIKQWIVPKFEILDTAPSYLTALIAETVWARRFVWHGYELANNWPEHRSSDTPRGLRDVPLSRLWDMTFAEAIADEVSIHIGCNGCNYRRALALERLRANVQLHRLRSLEQKCSECGGEFIQVQRPEPEAWCWASYQARAMPPRGSPLGLPSAS